MDIVNTNLAFYLIAYLIGGIPFGLLLAKKYANVDIKSEGSGNIGATNVLRVIKQTDPSLAKKLGAITLALDAFKGVVVLVIADMYGVSEATLWAIGVLSVLGHCYSPYLSFEGGKGVATGLGIFLYLMTIPAIIGIAIWGISAKVLKISSMSSLIGLAGVIVSSYIIYPRVPSINSHVPILLITLFIFHKHIPNIIRLFTGEESKVV
jgi:glycerol-3-phosphate acyltransferase PlsY